MMITAASRGLFGGFMLAALPMIAMHRGLNNFTDHWQECAFYAASALAGAMCAVRLAAREPQEKPPSSTDGTFPNKSKTRTFLEQNAGKGGIIFVFLYIAAAALCERLQLGSLPGDWPLRDIRILGLLAAIAGMIVQFKGLSGTRTDAPDNAGFRERHPICFGWIILLAGVPLIYAVWLPLLAIPGIFVGLNWYLAPPKS